MKLDLQKAQRLLASVFLFSLPASSTYTLKGYDVTGGGGETSSTQYRIYGALGGLDMADQILGTTRNLQSGLAGVIGTSVPPAPVLSNDANWYNRLKVVIDTAGNTASDTLFAISLSPDNWSSVFYVKADNTVGSVLSLADYRTYAGWGSASGAILVGLLPNTTYEVRATAIQGQYTESGFGPESTGVSTSAPILSFDVDVSAVDEETAPPFALAIGLLAQSAVVTAPELIWYDLDTNADGGATVWVKGLNGGLQSAANGHRITSSDADLDAVIGGEGFGLQLQSLSESSGGPLIGGSTYDSGGNEVGALSTSYKTLFSATNPLAGGRVSLAVKTTISDLTPAASDYQEVLMSVAVPSF